MRNMWPLLLDSSEEECLKTLRRLELEAYGCLVSALRAQGGLTSEKLKILKETASALHITPERHRAEIRRAVNDEQLCTIAQFADGPDTYAEWSVEGRRKVRLVPRVVPQTAFLAVARRVADVAQADNAKMPWPAATARAPPLPKAQSQTHSPQMKYEHEDRMPSAKKRRRLSEDSLASATQSQLVGQQSPQSVVYTTQPPGQKHHRLQKHGISKIQQMYKNQSRLAAAASSTTMRHSQQMVTSVPSSSSHQEIMPPPRTTIKTLPPVKQRVEVSKITTTSSSILTTASSGGAQQENDHQLSPKISQQQQHSMTTSSLTTPSPTIAAKVIHQNKSLIKIANQSPHQKLVIVSASQPINSNIIHQAAALGGSGGGTTKIITTPINTIKIKTTSGATMTAIDDLELAKCPKIISTNQQVIVSKSQLTPLHGHHHHHGHYSGHHHHHHHSGGGTEGKAKVLTVQAKVRPQGSIIVPLQGQAATSSGQFAGVSVPVLQGVQWKAIQGKSTVKLLPISGNAKIIQKQGGTMGSAPIYVMSKPSNILVNKSNDTETTKTTLNSITHIRPLTQKSDDPSSSSTTTTIVGGSSGGKLLVVRKATPIITTTTTQSTMIPSSSPTINVITSSSVSSTNNNEQKVIDDNDAIMMENNRKSTVLQDALRASGVTSVDDDIESQISQYTVIPKTKTWTSDTSTHHVFDHHHHHHHNPQSHSHTQSHQSASSTPAITGLSSTTSKAIQNIQLQDTKFLTLEEAVAILGDNSETRAILSHLQVDSNPTDGQLDPQTGIYSPTPSNNNNNNAISTTSLSSTLTSSVTTTTKQQTPSQLLNEEQPAPSLDIFSTALASADIQLDSVDNNDNCNNNPEFYTDNNDVIIDTTQLCPDLLDPTRTEDVITTITSDDHRVIIPPSSSSSSGGSTSLTDKQLTDILTGSDSNSCGGDKEDDR